MGTTRAEYALAQGPADRARGQVGWRSPREGPAATMLYFTQQLINGLTLGSIYGLIAIGYTMVYGIIGMINFAHGDIFMVGAFIALIVFMICSADAGITLGRRWRC